MLAQQLELAREIDRLTVSSDGPRTCDDTTEVRDARGAAGSYGCTATAPQWRACHYSLRVTASNHGSDPRDQEVRMTMTVKHPEVRVQLTGTDGNAPAGPPGT